MSQLHSEPQDFVTISTTALVHADEERSSLGFGDEREACLDLESNPLEFALPPVC
jgi:hypothetical protein